MTALQSSWYQTT